MIRRLLVTAGLCGLLTACASAPVYQRASDAAANRPAVTANFENSGNPALAAGEVPGEWWKLYDDARLNGLVTDALTANTDLRAAQARLERARIGLDLAQDASGVHTQVSGGFEYGKPSAEEYLLIGEHLPSDFLYATAAGASYQLDLAGQVKSAVDAAKADAIASQATYDAVRISVVADTTRAYVDACATGRQADIVRQALALQADNTVMIKRLVAAGRSSTTDVTRTVGSEAQTRSALPGILAAHQAALYRLAALTGRAPSELPADLTTCDAVPTLKDPIPVGDGAALLKRRPDIRAREAELSAATSRTGIARAALYPHVTLGASVTSTGLASRAFNQDTMGFMLGPLISWEFPNRDHAKADIKLADASVDEAQARFDGAVLTALRETETALNGYARDLDQRRDLVHAHDQAVKTLSDTQALQAAGKIAAMPVLDARRAVLVSDQALAQADARLAADQVQVFLALGGGWDAK